MKKILCPVDFSAATPFGIAPAASLSSRLDAGVILVHVSHMPSPQMDVEIEGFDLQEFLEERQAEAKQRLEEIAARSFAGASTRCMVENGNVAQTIVDLAEDEEVDLIVLPTHSRRGLDRLLLGSVAEKVVRLSPCPVLTAHPGDDAATEFAPARIVFATDFSESAHRALPDAMRLATTYGSELILVHVVSEPEFDPAIPEWSRPDVPSDYATAHIERATKRLEELAAEVQASGAEVDAQVHKGIDAAHVIVQAAEDAGAELIVMSTRGYTGLKHLLLGSTAERVVRYAECAVWTERRADD